MTETANRDDLPNVGHVGWYRFCRTQATRAGADASSAQICLMVGAETPALARRTTERALIHKRIDDESYRVRIDAIDHMVDLYKEKGNAFYVSTKMDDGWVDLRKGAHKRVDQVGADDGEDEDDTPPDLKPETSVVMCPTCSLECRPAWVDANTVINTGTHMAYKCPSCGWLSSDEDDDSMLGGE